MGVFAEVNLEQPSIMTFILARSRLASQSFQGSLGGLAGNSAAKVFRFAVDRGDRR